MGKSLDPRPLDAFLTFVSLCAPIREDAPLLEALSQHAHRLLDFERLTILLCNPNRQILRIIVIENQSSHDVSGISENEIPHSHMVMMRQVLLTGASSSGPAKHAGHTLMCLPMESDGRMVGVLCLAAGRQPYSGQQPQLFRSLTDYLAGTFARLGQDHEREPSPDVAHPPRQVSHFAQHDVLTDLPNRLLLNDRLRRALALSSRYRRRMAVLFLDLDNFKDINDTLGHGIGDRVLRLISDRLVTCVRSSDTVSRFGGDEFIVVLSELARPEDASVSAAKIIAAVTAPIDVAGHEIHLTLSVGASVYPEDGTDVDTLIKAADTAMYHAKTEGPGKFRFFRHDMNLVAEEYRLLEEDLRRAVERHEFVLHYQPRVDLGSGTIAGAEAVLGWLHPQRGLLRSPQFFSIAERSGLIVPIGEWALREACTQGQSWIDADLFAHRISVNVSATEVRRNEFADNVRRVLKESRLPAHCLDLELPQDVLTKEMESVLSILQRVKERGVRLTIDSFGTGYSSLEHLTRLPIDAIKIAPSLIQQLMPNANGNFRKGAGRVIATVIGMGKSLGHRVIGNGVGTSEQLEFLQTQGCDEAQGNLFSPPVAADQFANLLRRQQ